MGNYSKNSEMCRAGESGIWPTFAAAKPDRNLEFHGRMDAAAAAASVTADAMPPPPRSLVQTPQKATSSPPPSPKPKGTKEKQPLVKPARKLISGLSLSPTPPPPPMETAVAALRISLSDGTNPISRNHDSDSASLLTCNA